MAVFIRHSRTGRWYGGYNHWVVESDEAFDFEEARRAVEWISVVSLAEAEVVQSLDPRRYHLTLPGGPTELLP